MVIQHIIALIPDFKTAMSVKLVRGEFRRYAVQNPALAFQLTGTPNPHALAAGLTAGVFVLELEPPEADTKK